MHTSLFAGVSAGIFALLIATAGMIHQRYNRAMKLSVQNFERDWKQVEKNYETAF